MTEKNPTGDRCRTSFFGIEPWKILPVALILCAIEWLLVAINMVFRSKDLLLGIPLLIIGIAGGLVGFIFITLPKES